MITPSRIRLPLLVAVTTLSLIPTAQALSLSDWLKDDPYENGGTVSEQIQCYALPYGAIGFSSHILTYFTAFMLSRGKNPFLFWKDLNHRRFNLAIALIGFAITMVMTALTMARCRRTWPFILIAVWKLVLSVTLTGMTVQASLEILDTPKADTSTPSVAYSPYPTYPMNYFDTRGQYRELHKSTSKITLQTTNDAGEQTERSINLPQGKGRYHRVWYWFPLYFLGSVVGFVGIMNVVGKHIGENKEVKIITGAFGGVTLIVALFVLVSCWFFMSGTGCCGMVGVSFFVGAGVTVFVLSVLFAFYTDWVLAALAGDLVGTPSGDNAVFYWTYFAAKRLPMLSF
ncbi:hypothetical protein QBC38DRAFT_489373 [Podospora fimiseda]|uniref:Uncharacterized protein n=1 Tax=Podospora fimiseda TaxID=252190 RepID=A0AAN7BEB7_9PEZI|nr:hypothetical protein QBC38DRAFT_489373 [Podospora fimiseda]